MLFFKDSNASQATKDQAHCERKKKKKKKAKVGIRVFRARVYYPAIVLQGNVGNKSSF